MLSLMASFQTSHPKVRWTGAGSREWLSGRAQGVLVNGAPIDLDAGEACILCRFLFHSC